MPHTPPRHARPYDQHAPEPVHRKVKAAGIAGASVALVVAILGALGVDVPEGVATAAVAVIAAVAGYFTNS